MFSKLGEWVFCTIALKFAQLVVYCIAISAVWLYFFWLARQAVQESRLVGGLQLAAVRRPRLGWMRLRRVL